MSAAIGSMVRRVIAHCSSNVPVPRAGRIAFPPRVIRMLWGSRSNQRVTFACACAKASNRFNPSRMFSIELAYEKRT